MNPNKATKIIVLGAAGMMGHKLYQRLARKFTETYACTRRPYADLKAFGIFSPVRLFDLVDIIDVKQMEKILSDLKPDIVINCTGITLRKAKASDVDYCIEINSLVPHRLKMWAEINHARLIHFSTDCVFDGVEGSYTELSYPSARDIYGRTKYLGEVCSSRSLTLRGSIIGRELFGKTELLEWVLSKKGDTVRGFSQAIYSGLCTTTLADFVATIISNHSRLHGIYHYASSPISKYQLLLKLNAKFNLGINIEEDCIYVTKKNLISDKLTAATGLICPTWDSMITSLLKDKTDYL